MFSAVSLSGSSVSSHSSIKKSTRFYSLHPCALLVAMGKSITSASPCFSVFLIMEIAGLCAAPLAQPPNMLLVCRVPRSSLVTHTLSCWFGIFIIEPGFDQVAFFSESSSLQNDFLKFGHRRFTFFAPRLWTFTHAQYNKNDMSHTELLYAKNLSFSSSLFFLLLTPRDYFYCSLLFNIKNLNYGPR